MIKNEELVFDEDARRLVDCFALCFKINIRILSSGMDELMAGCREPNCRFCLAVRQVMRQGLQSRSRCRQGCYQQGCYQQDYLQQGCDQQGCHQPGCCRQASLLWEYREPEFESMVYACYTGLAEAVIPVKFKGIILGYALLGQFRTKGKINGGILRYWLNAGLDAETLKSAFEERSFFDKKTLGNMLRLFSMLLSFLVTREYIKIRQPGLAESVSRWLETHICESLDLNRIAAIMNRSRSTISHTVKRQFGVSFKELCILKRIQRFESIIAGDPDISIREAAALAGYRDPFYFSRIYKKVRLSAPSAYLKSIRKQEVPGDLGNLWKPRLGFQSFLGENC